MWFKLCNKCYWSIGRIACIANGEIITTINSADIRLFINVWKWGVLRRVHGSGILVFDRQWSNHIKVISIQNLHLEIEMYLFNSNANNEHEEMCRYTFSELLETIISSDTTTHGCSNWCQLTTTLQRGHLQWKMQSYCH